ncbi:MAG TPA: glycoside hydrolase family 15 protein [Thermoplasmata archaeon]|nr:glycoside hydrolase family 15 protein [Thermoplasmata archaeon]
MITQVAGNGRLLLTVNENGDWNELFYPYPGQFQQLREARLGLFDVSAGQFAWLRRGNGYSVTQSPHGPGHLPESTWSGHGVTITVRDHVHPNHDLAARVFHLRTEPARPVRLFAYHAFQIAESMYQDTAYVDPAAPSLVHYKRGFFFEFFSNPAFTRAVCGEHTLKGLQGTYVDAEDGRLEGRPVAHGAADSVMQWDVVPSSHGSARIELFMAAGRSLPAVHQVRDYVRHGGPSRFVRESERFWETWSQRRLPNAPPGLSAKAQDLYRASVLVMRHCAGTSGAIIASPDTRSLAAAGDTYNYCWWRDGGYVAKAMDEAGLYENASLFLDFAQSCQNPDGSFFHRHFPDGAIGSTWHPPPFLQIDQTATVIASAWHHFKRGNDPDVLLRHWPLVKGAGNFLAAFRDEGTGLPAASFDLWEERLGIHTYSTAAVAHGLERAARIATELGKDPSNWQRASEEILAAARSHLWDDRLGRFVRSVGPRDEKLDASVLLGLKLGLLPWDDPRTRRTVDAIEQRLWVPGVGGLARYEGDAYYGHENPWVICTLWLAEARLRLGDANRCRELIEWVAEKATPTRLLPEQIDRATGEPKSATPLTWSHSTFVDVVHKYAEAQSNGEVPDE